MSILVIDLQVEKAMLEHLIANYKPVDAHSLVKNYAWSLCKEEAAVSGKEMQLTTNFKSLAQRQKWYVEWCKDCPDLSLIDENSPYLKQKKSGLTDEYIAYIDSEWEKVATIFNLPHYPRR